MSDDEDIAELQRILNNLQIESDRVNEQQRRIQKDLKSFKKKLQLRRSSASAKPTQSNQHEARSERTIDNKANKEPKASKRKVIEDRYGKELKVGDKVYLYTRGVYKSRRGVIKFLEAPPKFCTIIDTDGFPQNRISTNLILETEDTIKYLH